mmetsp:Transcript_10843/g.9569  ORF Transcript_10843/g.9569 Transcript_10843/m.9569 type:complete len:148 (+) Transcript_10843:277-720(+)
MLKVPLRRMNVLVPPEKIQLAQRKKYPLQNRIFSKTDNEISTISETPDMKPHIFSAKNIGVNFHNGSANKKNFNFDHSHQRDIRVRSPTPKMTNFFINRKGNQSKPINEKIKLAKLKSPAAPKTVKAKISSSSHMKSFKIDGKRSNK